MSIRRIDQLHNNARVSVCAHVAAMRTAGQSSAGAEDCAILARPTPARVARARAARRRLRDSPPPEAPPRPDALRERRGVATSYLDLQALHDALGIHLRDVHEHR